jgi:hypothetical protein
MRDDSTPEIPYGYCECGCGQRTGLAKRSQKKYGHVKGQPYRFLFNHHKLRTPYQEDDYRVEDRGYKTPCHVWQRRKNFDGYGRLTVNGKGFQAHRYFYEQKYGPIPAGLDMDHLCRQHDCVNADHLEPVTEAENVRRGVTAKVTADDVREIRRLAPTLTRREIACRYGLSESSVYQIVTRRCWVDVD